MTAPITELKTAIAHGDLARIRRQVTLEPSLAMADSGDGTSVLLQAQYGNQHDVVAALLTGRPPTGVFEAAAIGQAERMRHLLRDQPELVRAYAPDGFTPLHVAAHFCRVDVVEVLLAHGADPTAVTRNDSRVTPLHSGVAARRGEHADVLAVVRLLLEHGAPVNAAQAGGFTVLHTAARRGDLDLVTLLLSHGADPGVADERGLDAGRHAQKRGHERVLAALAGA